MSLTLYRAATTLAAPLAPWLLRARARRGKEDPARRDERLGIAARDRPEGPLVWVHAASIGESLSALPLIERVLALDPALHVLVTTVTVTSAALMAQRLPPRALHQFAPLDAPPFVARFLDHWRPDMALMIESEFWPNLMQQAHTRGTVMILVNARISPRSAARWARVPFLIRPLLDCFDLCLAQNREEAQTLERLGARRVATPGNLKFAAAPLPADADELARLGHAIGARPLWLAASTHEGEEEIAGLVHRNLRRDVPGLLTLIAPRHPGRGGEIAARLAQSGLSVARRSAGEPITPQTDIYLADTTGEMGLLYRLSEIVFIGGSLIPHGGQNPIEAAQLDCAILLGPHCTNFRAIAGELLDAHAAQPVTDAKSLERAVFDLLRNGQTRRALAQNAKGVAAQKAHVLDSLMVLLMPFLRRCGVAANKATTGARAAPPGSWPARLRQAPEFWGRAVSLPAALLSPLAGVYGVGARLRRALARPEKSRLPVLCVGNLVAGGAGKTPAALALCDWLQQRGQVVHFLTRGYGAETIAARRVRETGDDFRAVGDEALLLSRRAPCWVGANRAQTAKMAQAAGARILVMDDGFQNFTLEKDFSFLVIDGGYGLGNGKLMPAGPLREHPRDAFARAQAVILIGADERGVAAAIPPGMPVLRARIEPGPQLRALQGMPLIAFCGIARPEKFFRTLEEGGCLVVARRAFPDHHAFAPGELAALREEAEKLGAELVTTAKDAVRLDAEMKKRVRVLDITLVWEDERELERLLRPLLEKGA